MPENNKEAYVYVLSGESLAGGFVWDMHKEAIDPRSVANVFVEVQVKYYLLKFLLVLFVLERHIPLLADFLLIGATGDRFSVDLHFCYFNLVIFLPGP